MAQALGQLPGGFNGVAACSIGRTPVGVSAQPDPQCLGLAARSGFEGVRRRRCPVRVTGPRLADAVEHPGTVAHAAADDTVNAEAGPSVARVGSQRDSAAVGLQPEEPAIRGRHTDRAAPVVGVRDRHDACGHRRGRPAAGPTGRMAGVPRICGRAIGHRLGRDGQAELGRVGAPEVHQSQRGEHGGQVCRARCGIARFFERCVAGVVGLAFGGAGQVLGEEWDPCQRSACVPRLPCGVVPFGRLAGAAVEPSDDGVDLRVEPVGPGDGLVEELDCGGGSRGEQLSGSHTVGQVADGCVGRCASGRCFGHGRNVVRLGLGVRIEVSHERACTVRELPFRELLF